MEYFKIELSRFVFPLHFLKSTKALIYFNKKIHLNTQISHFCIQGVLEEKEIALIYY